MAEPEARIYLARHAESVLNINTHIIGGRSNETPLTPAGEEQARSLGTYIARNDIALDSVYSSPAIRTLETTRIALEQAGLNHPVTIEEGIQELDQGEWTGLLRDEIYTPSRINEIERLEKTFKAPGGESMEDVGVRMLQTINNIVNNLENNNVATIMFTTHGFAIKCLAGKIHNWSRHRIYSSIVPNASLTHMTKTKGVWKLEYLGRDTF